MSVLPKKRGAHKQTGRGSSSVLHDLSNKGRNLSERVVSGQRRKPSGARHVSRGDMFVSHEEDANSSFAEDAIHFHENRSTIMSNFEEWIKLSTDNKITSKNSWHFALIDYFHDLNVIKDGDNINFQRASATLDGCVKIYSSRVESAASETGKLLSGLATKRGQLELEQASDDETEAAGETDPVTGKKERKKISRIVESTLVPFEAVQIKKLDQELAIDPLFKKALAEFDEGGAKSLLLNTLNIDSSGRVVFDATTNPMNSEHVTEHIQDDPDAMDDAPEEPEDAILDLSSLQNMLYAETDDLSTYQISPSMEQLKAVLSDVNKARSILTDVNSKFMAEEEEKEEEQQNPPPLENDDMPDFDAGVEFDDEDVPDAGLARYEEELQHEPFGPETQPPERISREKVLDSDLMAYFDERMKTNWRGPEHWRVTALKKSKSIGPVQSSQAPAASEQQPKRAKKEQVIIDFFTEDDDDVIEDMFRKSKNQFQISKRPEERRSSDMHILPEDIQFNSQKLVTLFLKPSKTISTFTKRARASGPSSVDGGNAYTDEQYFAEKYEERERDIAEEERQEKLALSFHQAEMEDCDNDNYGGIDFNDVLDAGDGPILEDLAESKEDLNSQVLMRKARPEYVNYSRVAKRVDIKLLKDNLWKSIKVEDEESNGMDEPRQESPEANEDAKQKSFKDVVDVIGTMYRSEEKKDLSTSFCFICLLHLANEHGLSFEPTESYDNMIISGF
ncbi:hypothetical protein OXX80_006604 [Metschnikowia pulcherrima]